MILPSARDCADIVADHANTASAYFSLAMKQIGTALDSGAYTCTLTTSGKQGADVKAVQGALKALGFTLTQTTTTITISWATA